MRNCLWTDAESPYLEAEALLGDAADDENVFSYRRLLEYDREEAFPDEPWRVLNDAGLSKQYVPRELGGELVGYEGLFRMWRAVAGRDLTVTIGHGKSFLGGICIWLAGSDEQKRKLASEMVADTIVSWGLTEREHGADLLSGELAAHRIPDGWVLEGEKWLINNATRGHMICVLARTAPEGGPRGFSLFLVDKRKLPNDSYRFLPKERTYGIRGADISGIAFDNARIPSDALVGELGGGLETTLKALQITRTVVAGLSMGAGDHALKLVGDFANEHHLYGRQLASLPLVRHNLGEALAAIFVTEVVSAVAARSLHTLPGEMSVISAITKAFVPSTIDEVVAKLGEQLGARSFLTHEYAHGAFQKLERDSRLIAIFDGSTVVNRNAVIDQFPLLSRAFHAKYYDRDSLSRAAAIDQPVEAMDYSRLELLSRKGCSMVQSLPDLIKAQERELATDLAAPAIGELLPLVDTALRETMEEMASYRPKARSAPTRAFHLASRYELLFAAAACLQFWQTNRERRDSPLWRNGLWLEAALTHITARLAPGQRPAQSSIFQRIFDAATPSEGAGRWSLLRPATSGGE